MCLRFTSLAGVLLLEKNETFDHLKNVLNCHELQ